MVAGQVIVQGVKQAENSEVLLSRSVAVAMMTGPTGVTPLIVTEKAALPAASVVTLVAPRNCRPSPLPLASHDGLAKNSTRYCELGALFNVPSIVTPLPVMTAAVMTGKFCSLFAPVSGSPASLGVTP